MGVFLFGLGALMLLLHVGRVGVIGSWSPWVVLAPWWAPLALVLLLLITRGIRSIAHRPKASFWDGTDRDGFIKEFFRRRRATRWAREKKEYES